MRCLLRQGCVYHTLDFLPCRVIRSVDYYDMIADLECVLDQRGEFTFLRPGAADGPATLPSMAP